MKQIGQGRTADIYEMEENKILKLYKENVPEASIQYEYLVSSMVYKLGIDTPEPYELTSVNNRKGIVFQRVSGFSLLSLMSKRPWSVKKSSRTLAVLHYNLHTCDADKTLRNQKAYLSEHIKAAPLLSAEEKTKILDYLDKLSDGKQLCHADFHPDNVLVGERSWIIDWMTGMAGNPAGDVARTILLCDLGTMPDGTPRPVRIIVDFLRKTLKNEYIKQYLKLSRQEYSEIDRWILPVAAARLVEWIPQEERSNLVQEIRRRLRAIS